VRLVILGAGASKAAGYPLAAEVLDEVGRVASTSASVQLKEAWEAWVEFRDAIPEPLKLIATNSNPEVVLTLPDLYSLALENEDDHQRTEAIRGYMATGEADASELEDYFDSAEWKALAAAARPRARLLDALEWYFLFRHHEDQEQRSRREYLRPLMEGLEDGDVVITLNWDTVAERTLAEIESWDPIDGYGFKRTLAVSGPLGVRDPLPQGYRTTSPICVLKLHGSVGWRRDGDNVYLDSVMLLREFGFYFDGDPIELIDTLEPDFAGRDPPLIAYPSFLKQLDHPILDEVWRQAADALATADEVDVWGYSLPSSDGAIRALLQTLSVRLRRGSCSVVVHDPSETVLRRWKAFLGSGGEFRQETLE